jgi:thymidine kinase
MAVFVAEHDIEVIGIDEAFMFEDPQDFRDTVELWLHENRRVIASSLDVLGNQTVPPVVSKLLELAPRIRQYESSCDYCKDEEAEAIFTIITDEFGSPIPKDKLQDILVEGEQTVEYTPACRPCYQQQYPYQQ